jgi:3-deoxy-D-manno-octulosonic-acid transferase
MANHPRLAAIRATAGALRDVLRGHPHPRWRKFLRDTWGRPRIVHRGRPVIWLVCAAGGEVVQAAGLVRGLRHAFPEATLVLSTSNHAFLDLAQRMSGLDACLYTPWDVRRACARAVAALRPDVVVSVESAWNPVLLRQARRRGARTLLASGTLRADYHLATPYRRPMRRRVLQHLDVAGVTDDGEVAVFEGLGVPAARVQVLGDLRLDAAFSEFSAADRAALAARVGVEPDDHVLVAGSVHPGEDALVLDAFAALREDDDSMRLIVAPRHGDAVHAVETAARARGFTTARLGQRRGHGAPRWDVLVVDTYGDLRRLYGLATAAFVGGTVVKIGLGLGQNLVEPLVHGVPVFFGQHVRRWVAVTDALRAIEPALLVASAGDLAAGIRALAAAPDRVKALRECAGQLVAGGARSVAQHVDAIGALIGGRPPA